MTGLLLAEIRRLTSRRLFRLLGLAALVIVVLVQGKAFFDSNRDLDASRRRVSAEITQQRESCEEAKALGKLPAEVDCTSFGGGFLGEPPDPRLLARKVLPEGARAVAVGVAIVAFVVGASSIGAEWGAGTMQALLFWEPRRGRVLLAKGIALVTVMVVFAAVLQLLVYANTYLTAATRGSTAGVTAGLQVSVLLTALRGMVVVACTGLLGFAVTGLARVTGAALGVAFVYFVILENLLRGLRPGWQRFLFSENVAAIMLKRIPVTVAGGRRGADFDGTFREAMYQLTGVRGAVTLGVYLTILLGIFYATFSRRDVT